MSISGLIGIAAIEKLAADTAMWRYQTGAHG